MKVACHVWYLLGSLSKPMRCGVERICFSQVIETALERSSDSRLISTFQGRDLNPGFVTWNPGSVPLVTVASWVQKPRYLLAQTHVLATCCLFSQERSESLLSPLPAAAGLVSAPNRCWFSLPCLNVCSENLAPTSASLDL